MNIKLLKIYVVELFVVVSLVYILHVLAFYYLQIILLIQYDSKQALHLKTSAISNIFSLYIRYIFI